MRCKMLPNRKFSDEKETLPKESQTKEPVEHFPLIPDLLRSALYDYVSPHGAELLAAGFQGVSETPQYKQIYDQKRLQLLQHIARGEYKSTEAVVVRNYQLALEKGAFTEELCGQRVWTSVSPLQYAAWAGDTQIVDLI